MNSLLKQQNKVEGADKMSSQQMDDTVGSILSFLKTKGVDMEAVKKAIPNADKLLNQAETDHAKRSADNKGSGLMGALGGIVAGASPAVSNTTSEAPTQTPISSMPGLLTSLKGAGVDPKQVNSVVPLVANLLNEKAGINVYKQLGVPEPAPEQEESTGGGGFMSGLRGAASNFVKDFKTETTGKA